MEGGFRWQGLVGKRRKDLVTRFGEEAVAEEGVEEQERM
jgi:macrodomain Ter protein organizer (MatP/YcbG family)